MDTIHKMLESYKIDINFLKENSKQIILFDTDKYDLNILIISDKELNYKNDEINIHNEILPLTESFLCSELANHIKGYGKWIHGTNDWTNTVFVSKKLLELKKNIIEKYIGNINLAYRNNSFSFETKKQLVLNLRRELQLYCKLYNEEALPSSKILDRQWKYCNRYEEFNKMLDILSKKGHLVRVKEVNQLLELPF